MTRLDLLTPQGELTIQALSFDVTGMTCGGCTGSVQRVLSRPDGVSHAEVTLRPGVATLEVDPDRVTAPQVELKRIVEYLSPLETRVVALGKPSSRERTAWYFQRYVAQLPVAGEFVLFTLMQP